jgi:hypothetical protein
VRKKYTNEKKFDETLDNKKIDTIKDAFNNFRKQNYRQI